MSDGSLGLRVWLCYSFALVGALVSDTDSFAVYGSLCDNLGGNYCDGETMRAETYDKVLDRLEERLQGPLSTLERLNLERRYNRAMARLIMLEEPEVLEKHLFVWDNYIKLRTQGWFY